ncbi:ABC-type branched-subunit amino acid transport system ATPase component [Bradyrhizobium diazoefficiens]
MSAVLGPPGSRPEQEGDDAMREMEIHDYARQLLEAHGLKAIAEAAQNAIDLEQKGELELAKTWRHIEDAMKLMRGPHQS